MSDTISTGVVALLMNQFFSLNAHSHAGIIPLPMIVFFPLGVNECFGKPSSGNSLKNTDLLDLTNKDKMTVIAIADRIF